MLPDAHPAEALPWDGGVLASTDVKEYWYVLHTSSELTPDRPHSVRLLGEPLVLFRDAGGAARAFADRCPHKNVRLSDGKMKKGTLQCFYHGWEFNGESGAVTKVPALPKNCELPKQCVKTFPCVEKDELIWVYPGNPVNADPDAIPTKPVKANYKKNGYWRDETIIDLPCDHSFFTENLMDIAHTPWAHDGLFTRMSDALPLKPKFHMTPTGMYGFIEEFRNLGQSRSVAFDWRAPCNNDISIRRKGMNWHLHLFFHNIPTAPGQMRHIQVVYRNMDRFIQYIPKSLRPPFDLWIIHGDTIAMLSQARNMREGCPHITVATPSDEMAIKYRKWHSKAFAERQGPWWKGWDGKLDIEDLATSAMETCLPQFGRGIYEKAASVNSSSNANSADCIVTMWKVQQRRRKALGFEQGSSSLTIAVGIAAGLVAAVVVLKCRP